MKKFFTLLLCTCLLLGTLATLTAHATDSLTQTVTDTDTDTSTDSDTGTVTVTDTDTQTSTEEQSTAVLGYTDIPSTVIYNQSAAAQGYALGTININMPIDHNATSFALYWGDAKGQPLEGYSAFYRGELSGSFTSVEITEEYVVPEHAKSIQVYTYSEAFGQSPTPYWVSFYAVTRPDLGKALSEFVVVSDLHLGKDKTAAENFVGMLKDVKATAPNAAGIIVVGDTVHAATDENYALFDELSASVEGIPPIYQGLGEHEYWMPDASGISLYNPQMHGANLQRFLDRVKIPQGTKPTTPYYTYTLGDVTMVFIAADFYDGIKAVYSETQRKWLSDTLAKADPDKPVFVYMHEPFPNTVSGTGTMQGYGNIKDADTLKSIFEKYSNLIVFNGHSHWDMQAERTMHRLKGGSYHFNTASVAHLRLSSEFGGYDLSGSQGYYVTVCENGIWVRGRDFITGEWIGQAEYIITLNDPESATTESATAAPTAASTTKAPSTKAPSKTTASSESETEEGEETGIRDLIPPLTLLAIMAAVVFIIVFRKPKNEP